MSLWYILENRVVFVVRKRTHTQDMLNANLKSVGIVMLWYGLFDFWSKKEHFFLFEVWVVRFQPTGFNTSVRQEVFYFSKWWDGFFDVFGK